VAMVGKRKVFGKACVVCGRRRYCHLSPTGCWQTYNRQLHAEQPAVVAEDQEAITQLVPLSTRDLFANADMEGVRSAAK